LFIGETGAGKTALVHESAVQLARKHPVEQVGDHLVTGIIVCDPDHYPGKWPGCEVAGAGNDYEAIASGCERVLHEYDLRVEVQSAVGIRSFEPVWLVIDEYWDIWHRDERIQRAVESILRRGRKLNVHLWIGSQDNQAASIGLAGETKLMKNFTYVCELARGRDDVRFLHPKKYTDSGRNEPAGEPRAVPWIEMPQASTHMTYREFIMTMDHRNTDLLTQLLESPKASIEQTEKPEDEDFTPSRVQDFKISDLRGALTEEYDITEEEWALLIRCWQIYESNGQRKAAALQEAFGVRPGGTRNYQRASQLFDALLRHHVLQSV
jgi:hypothetical protein